MVYFFIKNGRNLVYFLVWFIRRNEKVAVGTLSHALHRWWSLAVKTTRQRKPDNKNGKQ